jgi:hypothetical protein
LREREKNALGQFIFHYLKEKFFLRSGEGKKRFFIRKKVLENNECKKGLMAFLRVRGNCCWGWLPTNSSKLRPIL